MFQQYRSATQNVTNPARIPVNHLPARLQPKEDAMSAAQTESAAPNASDAPHHKPEFPKKAVLIVSVIVLLIAAVSQIAGPLIIPLGKSIKVTLLPMLWGLVIGTGGVRAEVQAVQRARCRHCTEDHGRGRAAAHR
jgi:hypothetical protein